MKSRIRSAVVRVGLASLLAVAMIASPEMSRAGEVATQHKSVLHIDYGTPIPAKRNVRVGLNKSMVVELPGDISDVVVSNPEVLDAVVQTSNRIHLIGRKLGEANAFFFNSDGERVLTVEVSVDRDTSTLSELLNRLIPGSNISVEMLNDTVILTGTVRNAIDSNRASDIASRFAVSSDPGANQRDNEKVINMLAVQSRQQVLLKVTVAEMQRNAIKRLGVNWNSVQFGDTVLSGVTNNAFPISGASGFNSFLTGQFGGDAGACGDPLSIFNNIPQDDESTPPSLNCTAAAVEAFERNGLLRTLAEPTLTAISGETASFLAGGEFPIPVASDDDTITVEWKPFGVGLSFTPLVMSERRISLKVATEVSELTTEASVQLSLITLPGLKVRRANTTVELPSGGSLVMAGLISDDTRQNFDGVPGLGKLPVLGSLFRSRDFQKKETELVVIITPYVVKPTARSNLARPDDNFVPSSDARAMLLGQLNQVYGKSQELPKGEYQGDVGFIVE